MRDNTEVLSELATIIGEQFARSVAARIEAAADEAKPPFKDRGNGWIRSSSSVGLLR